MKSMKQSRPQTKGQVNCVYCNCECDPEQDEFVITKRKTINYFHKRCYYVYGQLGFDVTTEDNK